MRSAARCCFRRVDQCVVSQIDSFLAENSLFSSCQVEYAAGERLRGPAASLLQLRPGAMLRPHRGPLHQSRPRSVLKVIQGRC